MGKPINHPARVAAWVLLCAAGFGIPVILFFSSGAGTNMVPIGPEVTIAKHERAQEKEILDPDRQTEDLPPVREAAREPMSALAAPAKPAPPPDPDTLPKRWRLVHKPVATAAGVFDVGGVTIVLPGLDTVSTSETCIDATDSAWPCGMGARTAFRAYLRGRSLNCKLPDQSPVQAILGECLLQGDDPAAWLVRNGWARAKLDGPYVSLELDARTAKRGIFGPRPR